MTCSDSLTALTLVAEVKRMTSQSFNFLFESLKLAMLVSGLAVMNPVYPGVFMLAERLDVNIITHPVGYTGAGRELPVTVGIKAGTPNSFEMVIPLLNAIRVWNELIPTWGNVNKTGSNVPPGQFDFESVLLHELGHCIGLDHPNLASESGLSGADRDYTKTTRGADGVYNLDPGTDGVIGSNDDQRGDDVNLHWFRKANNNPFTIEPKVDRTTYSRDLFDLPPGHLYAATGSLRVANLFGLTNSEAVMQQGISTGEAHRTLNADDVATLRLAMSGFDSLAGTTDDYTVFLEFAGFTDNADIVVRFGNAQQTTFAACEISAVESRSNSGHFVITKGDIYFRDDINWFFNQVDARTLPKLVVAANGISSAMTLAQSEHLLLDVSLVPTKESLHNPADYWVRADTPIGVFWLNERFEFVRSEQPVRVHGGPLIPINRFPILNGLVSSLPPGDYLVTFAVDNNENGIFEGSFQGTVNITVVP
jgi:hypothetical protein